MKKLTMVFAFMAAGILMHRDASAQGFLKKLKDKAADAANKSLEKKTGVSSGESTSASDPASPGQPSSTRSGRPANKVGEGLKNTTPPDVKQQIADAEAAQSAGKLGEARYSVRQALLGIELQLGKEVLKSLPSTVVNLPKDTLEDRVTSTQWGWANLTIQRVYRQDDKQLTLIIGNNSLYAGFIDMYFANSYAAESNGDTQNFKQIKVKGNKAVIKFAENEGYTVIVQLGQAGMITYQGVNFSTEQDMMAAVNAIDTENIKKMLGEK